MKVSPFVLSPILGGLTAAVLCTVQDMTRETPDRQPDHTLTESDTWAPGRAAPLSFSEEPATAPEEVPATETPDRPLEAARAPLMSADELAEARLDSLEVHSEAWLGALFQALADVESSNDPEAWNESEGARGLLQIRPIMVQDVNRICGEHRYSVSDAYDPVESHKMLSIFCGHYVRAETIAPGWSLSSFELAARKWNGGPTGDQKAATLPYWLKVKARLLHHAKKTLSARLERTKAAKAVNPLDNPLNASRGNTYGHPRDHFPLTEHLFNSWKTANAEHGAPVPKGIYHAVYMVCDKLARLAATPTHEDSWLDVGGYANTALSILKDQADGRA